MKKFKFGLQALLNIREAKEREVQYELARLLAIQNREKERQAAIRAKMEEQKSLFSRKLRQGIYSGSDAVMLERFIDVSNRAIEAAETNIQSMEPGIAEVRSRLIEASREKKVVEHLRERKKAEYDYEVNREINKEIDEMNQKIFAKRRAAAEREAARD